ncbi:hypothetical protein [Pseudomonas sp. UMAB-40]|uniref:hypothetical protein n=1 Tax=Pseudomonas sp. UMAB-40 TaxID=1365407 RepID=UPI001C55E2A1|nr:hypothetical protein [Pseudomonas sp. UMAB-40]
MNTELNVSKVALVGPVVNFEVAAMASTDTLWFSDRSDADRFMSAVVAAGNEASLCIDEEAHEFNDPDVYGVTYSGFEVTQHSETPYSACGRRASRFYCHD